MTTKEHDTALSTKDKALRAAQRRRDAALFKAQLTNAAANKAKRIVKRRQAQAWSDWCRRDAQLATALREARDYYGGNSKEAVEAYYDYAANKMPPIPDDESLKEVRAA